MKLTDNTTNYQSFTPFVLETVFYRSRKANVCNNQAGNFLHKKANDVGLYFKRQFWEVLIVVAYVAIPILVSIDFSLDIFKKMGLKQRLVVKDLKDE
ncbi:MAG: hypothetical protein LW832_09020 [Parachlamydia sp.]|jgi:hypothetical protein|nr:hypothetical protein [Parachlamydia sp.]